MQPLPENIPQPTTSYEASSEVLPQLSISNENSEDDSSPNEVLLAKLDKYKTMYLREKRKAENYKRLLRNNKKQIAKMSGMKKVMEYPLLQQLFNKDQIVALEKRQRKCSTKFMKWSNVTITNSLKLKFSCGGNGYEELIKEGYPLPSIRTLQRRLQNLKFDCGILNEVFDFLKIKVESFEAHEMDCVLVLDEMAITPGNTYDSSLNKYYGNVTLPDHSGIATHVLVFMLGGVNTRWKQIVAYYFTGDSVNGAAFNDIIKKIFDKAVALGLNILSITSDMGPANQALWKTWGVTAGRHSLLRNKINHPLEQDNKVYIFADVPHLFKNIKAMLMSNKIIYLPSDVQQKYGLPTKEVCSSHIVELLAHEEQHCFKLAPKLTEEDLLPNHFNKMKVSTSTNVIAHTVSSALKFLAEVLHKPAYLTTAWFLDQVERWFYLMSSRYSSCALSKFNDRVYSESITFLKDFMYLFSKMEVGLKKIWKPSQTGVLISTESMLELQAYLLEIRGYKYVLTSRFSQDCLENLFSVLRSKQVIPNAQQVKNNLKLISVSQYLKHLNNSSYEEDDRDFLSGFLDVLTETKPQYEVVNIPNNIDSSTINLNFSEINSLYNICGYIMQSIMKTSTTCKGCIDAAGSKKPLYRSFTKFTNIKRFQEHTLFFVTEELFYFFLEMENIFRKFFPIVSPQNVNVKEFLCNHIDSVDFPNIPNCHKLKSKIINRYIVFRLKINSKKCKTVSKRYASKSVASHY